MGTATGRPGRGTREEDALHGETQDRCSKPRRGAGRARRARTARSGWTLFEAPRPRKCRVTHDATPEISPHARPAADRHPLEPRPTYHETSRRSSTSFTGSFTGRMRTLRVGLCAEYMRARGRSPQGRKPVVSAICKGADFMGEVAETEAKQRLVTNSRYPDDLFQFNVYSRKPRMISLVDRGQHGPLTALTADFYRSSRESPQTRERCLIMTCL